MSDEFKKGALAALDWLLRDMQISWGDTHGKLYRAEVEALVASRATHWPHDPERLGSHQDSATTEDSDQEARELRRQRDNEKESSAVLREWAMRAEADQVRLRGALETIRRHVIAYGDRPEIAEAVDAIARAALSADSQERREEAGE